MGNRPNVIMLNGKRYDAVTGEQIDEPHNKNSQHTPVSKRQPATSVTKTVDGFTKRKVLPTTPNKSGRKPEKSKTLMRGAVKKPSGTPPPKKSKASVTPKVTTSSSNQIDPVRELRATQTKRSKLISKFGDVKSKVKFAPISVVQPPKSEVEAKAKSPVNNLEQISQPAHVDRFKGALESAASHNQPRVKRHSKRAKLAHKLRVSPRLLNITAVLMVGILIGGYVAFNNVPNLAMKIASTRSGVDAQLPGYQPSGFAINGPIQYKPGQITLSFNSNSDQRSYSVNQSKSEWNSEALLENHVAVKNRAYQTFQDKGKTIYLYDGDNASWVDNGVWYEIDGNSALNSDQIIRIANSL